MTGSAIADASGLGKLEIDAMRKEGYDDGFSCAITAASATIGPIFPPSIPAVIYAMLTGASVGALFMAGMMPKVQMLRRAIDASGRPVDLQVDGGIGLSTAPLVAAAGADVLVCGNAVFKADDPRAAIGAVKDAADEAREAALARGQWN